MSSQADYGDWTYEQLIDRVTRLEQQLHEQTLSIQQKPSQSPARFLKKTKPKKNFDFSKYNTRVIALKFAYLGQRYNGFEYHANNATPLPTIEEVLWKALTKTKLIPINDREDISWEGCEYAKCGRTDKGVSAFGQVISLRVRSNRPKPWPVKDSSVDDEDGSQAPSMADNQSFDHIKDEIPYARMLNRVLPHDVRIISWCPSLPPDFSARFSCGERRYRYFFPQPAYTPRPDEQGILNAHDGTSRRAGWLNIAAMREAANHLMGLHDFRNFCKLDAGRQITNFQRRITYAAIEEAPSSSGFVKFVNLPEYRDLGGEPAKFYTFTVHGSAFLWHQVRHMVAILFHVGLGLEKPSVVQELLDIQRNPTKPMYVMADDAPLVLWDCVFPELDNEQYTQSDNVMEDALEWVHPDEQPDQRTTLVDNNGRFGPGGLQEVLWANWQQRKIDEVLAASLLDRVAARGSRASSVDSPSVSLPSRSTRIFEGGVQHRFAGEYIPIMQRQRMEPVEIINARYSGRKSSPRDDTSSPNIDCVADE